MQRHNIAGVVVEYNYTDNVDDVIVRGGVVSGSLLIGLMAGRGIGLYHLPGVLFTD
ncbi:hypothetical protein SP41_83 [Salmonella phage 41]|nr:hypothetical protein SP41_83 [Salmonella phage 41]